QIKSGSSSPPVDSSPSGAKQTTHTFTLIEDPVSDGESDCACTDCVQQDSLSGKTVEQMPTDSFHQLPTHTSSIPDTELLPDLEFYPEVKVEIHEDEQGTVQLRN